jgi:hypothetical protein
MGNRQRIEGQTIQWAIDQGLLTIALSVLLLPIVLSVLSIAHCIVCPLSIAHCIACPLSIAHCIVCIQWVIDKGRTIQWAIDKGQTIQWAIEKAQTIQWAIEGQTMQFVCPSIAHCIVCPLSIAH